jgi:thiosulfate dehydrogenase
VRRFIFEVIERMSLFRLILFSCLMVVLLFVVAQIQFRLSGPGSTTKKSEKTGWVAPDTSALPKTPYGDLVRYGRDLIANTSYYLGPKGNVAHIANAMNCQNCHIGAGAKSYGNSFAGVASMYPLFRPRSGIIESIEFRIKDCILRSLNGKDIDSTGLEMRAMVAYLKWIGRDVPKGTKPAGAGSVEPPYLNRAADTLKGKMVYIAKCQVCHGKKGEGILKEDGVGFIYPPLWGNESYNIGAGLFRLGRFAGFVKYSMPLGATFEKPQLNDEEAWDVAAFVNSQPHPMKFFSQDWPDIKKKAIDYPYGPYADPFSEMQHKYGPFGPMKVYRDSVTATKANAGK